MGERHWTHDTTHEAMRTIINDAAAEELVEVGSRDHAHLYQVLAERFDIQAEMKPDHIDDHNQLHGICNELHPGGTK